MQHLSTEGKERQLPEYAFDYCFPGDEFGYKWTVLVGKERLGEGVMATAVPQKGSVGMFAIDKVLEFVSECGDKNNPIIVKSDQENAIELLVEDVVNQRPEEKTFVEEAPKNSKGSAGLVERAVQEMEGRIRALFLSLSKRLGRELDARERIVAFIPEYAAYLYNRLIVGEDGKTAYQRMKGKKPTVLGVEFG